MHRIIEISKIKLLRGNVLLKLVMNKESKIILPETVDKDNSNVSYAIVVAVANDVEDLKPGDIVLDFGPSSGFKWKDEYYCLVLRMAILFAIDSKDFDPDKKKPGLAI